MQESLSALYFIDKYLFKLSYTVVKLMNDLLLKNNLNMTSVVALYYMILTQQTIECQVSGSIFTSKWIPKWGLHLQFQDKKTQLSSWQSTKFR